MCQRVGVALSMACEPEVLIADEPTTALDVLVQATILLLLKRAHAERGLSIILITHDFGVLRALATRVIVMYAGQIQEQGRVDDVLANPQHPYTKALIQAVPDPDSTDQRLHQIEGQPPDLLNLPRRLQLRRPLCLRHAEMPGRAPGTLTRLLRGPTFAVTCSGPEAGAHQ